MRACAAPTFDCRSFLVRPRDGGSGGGGGGGGRIKVSLFLFFSLLMYMLLKKLFRMYDTSK